MNIVLDIRCSASSKIVEEVYNQVSTLDFDSINHATKIIAVILNSKHEMFRYSVEVEWYDGEEYLGCFPFNMI